ncbi:hypothetical protein OG206_32165 [Streptomyces sp. NBC_01341]|uniref:hypothetical protein n=1 Tax=Streptomyces sp. NBC_01341 TaxID=2903831 RepID=UPI002E112E3D|nr:hypothetical protein OG206_32165 [Streptomyces sp. NBC_01341]
MNQRRIRQVQEATRPLLNPADTIDHVGLTKVGSVSVRRRLATTAATAILSGGHLIAIAQPRPMYFALTRERMLFFDPHAVTGSPGPVQMQLPRELLSTAPLRKALLGLGLQTVLTIDGADQAFALTFPPVAKPDARALDALLPRTR